MLRHNSIVRHLTSPALSPILLLALAILVSAGCPGGLDVSRYGDRGPQQLNPDGGGPAPVYDAWSKPPPGSDAKPISIDIKLPTADAKKPTPDTKPPPDQGPPPPPPAGGACTTNANCPAGQLCINKKCYNSCTTTDPCGVVSKCAVTEACVMYNNNPATKICYPATAQMGANCKGAGLFCPNGAICGSLDNVTFKCVYTCNNPGAVCAGGTCYATGTAGCNLCL